MKNLLSKFSITPEPWEAVRNHSNTIYSKLGRKICDMFPFHEDIESFNNQRLISIAPELLLALIKAEMSNEERHGRSDSDNQNVIEAATGKPWAEIKIIIEEMI